MDTNVNSKRITKELPARIPTKLRIEGDPLDVEFISGILFQHGLSIVEEAEATETRYITSLAGLRCTSDAGDPMAAQITRRWLTIAKL